MHHLVRIPQSDRRRTSHCLLYDHLGFHRRQHAVNVKSHVYIYIIPGLNVAVEHHP